jgi:hypothetical protein
MTQRDCTDIAKVIRGIFEHLDPPEHERAVVIAAFERMLAANRPQFDRFEFEAYVLSLS